MKAKLATIISRLPSFWMSLAIAILLAAVWVLYQIAWHSPSSMQSYESAQICAALKKYICEEAGFANLPASPCGDRDARWSAGDFGTRIEVYGVTGTASKQAVISLASSELKRYESISMLDIQFYGSVGEARLIETKQIRRQQ